MYQFQVVLFYTTNTGPHKDEYFVNAEDSQLAIWCAKGLLADKMYTNKEDQGACIIRAINVFELGRVLH